MLVVDRDERLTDHVSGSVNWSSASGSRSPSGPPRRPLQPAHRGPGGGPLSRGAGAVKQRFHLRELRSQFLVVDQSLVTGWNRASDSASSPMRRIAAEQHGCGRRTPVLNTLLWQLLHCFSSVGSGVLRRSRPFSSESGLFVHAPAGAPDPAFLGPPRDHLPVVRWGLLARRLVGAQGVQREPVG